MKVNKPGDAANEVVVVGVILEALVGMDWINFRVSCCGCMHRGKVSMSMSVVCTSRIDVVEYPERDHSAASP